MSTKTQLENLLTRLEQNRANVPLDLLKTKYKAGYELLLNQIKLTSRQYIDERLGHYQVHRSVQPEAERILHLAIDESDYICKLSRSLYLQRDINEYEQIINDLLDFLMTTMEHHFPKYRWIKYSDSEIIFAPVEADMARRHAG